MADDGDAARVRPRNLQRELGDRVAPPLLRGLRRESVPLDELRTMLSCFRYLFEQPDDGYYKPLPLPHKQTIGERASLCAEDDGYARYPMLREMVRFVLGRRTVVAAGAAGSASSAAANRDDGGGGELVGRALCRPA